MAFSSTWELRSLGDGLQLLQATGIRYLLVAQSLEMEAGDRVPNTRSSLRGARQQSHAQRLQELDMPQHRPVELAPFIKTWLAVYQYLCIYQYALAAHGTRMGIPRISYHGFALRLFQVSDLR